MFLEGEEEWRVGMGKWCWIVGASWAVVLERSGFRMEVVPMVFMLPFEWECGCDIGRVEERPMVVGCCKMGNLIWICL